MSAFRPNARALITGGASGIGLAVALLCLENSMKVTIVDSNEASLDLAKGQLKGDVEVIKADVGSRRDWKQIKASVGDVDVLMLNAGVGKRGTWGDEEYFDTTLHTNLQGVINGLNTYVTSFQSRSSTSQSSAIIITGSKQGITNPPGNAAYNASKAAVKALAEHLSYDLKDMNVGVHLLVPGWTFTGLTGATPSSTKPAGAWTPAQVAAYMYTKMSENKFYIICPDNDVTEEMDKKRMLWSAGDLVKGRPPLSRWRKEYNDEVEAWMKDCEI